MKKFKNKELRLSLTNLLALEEHFIELMFKATSKDEREVLFFKLQKIKNLRNNLVSSSPNEKDRTIDFNKWCVIKHTMLSQYHLMETVNQNDMKFDLAEQYLTLIKELEVIIEDIIDMDVTGNCDVCKSDLLINKLFKKNK